MNLSLANGVVACLLTGAALTALRPNATAAESQPTRTSTTPRSYPERLQWWAQGRFGIFIHWGPVSLKGTEISWSRANTNPKCPNKGPIPAAVYDNLYKEFNPTNFNGKQWAATIKDAGAKYLVLTAKHCDGFLLWHSQASDYNIAATPFQRDICAELSAAVHQQGLRIGWYFSPMDWRDPDFRTDRNGAFLSRMQAEVRELVSNFGTIDLLWFDWDGREPVYDQARTYQIVKDQCPNIIIDNRLDLGPTNSNTQILSTNADYYTPEQSVGTYDDQRPWESCMTLSRRDQWAWGGKEDGVKTLEACLNMLIRCAGGDGNLLLNIGPTPTGEIDPEQANRLRQIGTWLSKNGESIYGTRGGPFKPGEYGVSTRKGNTVYLHICDWPEGALKLPGLPAKVLRSRALGNAKLKVSQSEAGIEVSVPEDYRHPVDTIVALELDRDALSIPAVEVPAPVCLTTKAKATASNVYQHSAEYEADKAVDARGDTRWATDSGVKSAWLQVDLGRPTTFSRAAFSQAYPELNRIRKFAIEYLKGDRWEPCCTGGNPGAKFKASFKPVTAQRVRLNLMETTDGPTIWEFQLFR
jgi:alpha-L-fucosidase